MSGTYSSIKFDEIATGGDNDEKSNLTLTHPPRNDKRGIFAFLAMTRATFLALVRDNLS
jgi:hypothetical protein